ncbi:Dabb family protein [Cerasicoccus maritimus]|uniref:Dabb family protein n=1 Tax=Cerasicoccus maritimus TaxID=490089 RepID=UPI002852A33F|nr:Dabb family protein [Cerasicoccus maritimus]
MITHVVVFWLDKPYGENRDQLLAAAKELGDIPGCENFRTGAPVPSTRGVVDDSFAVAISMDFADQATADAYQSHPDHLKFVNESVKPFVKRFVVYDFGIA